MKLATRPKIPDAEARFLDDLLEKISRGKTTPEQFRQDYIGKLSELANYDIQQYWQKFRNWGKGQYGE